MNNFIDKHFKNDIIISVSKSLHTNYFSLIMFIITNVLNSFLTDKSTPYFRSAFILLKIV